MVGEYLDTCGWSGGWLCWAGLWWWLELCLVLKRQQRGEEEEWKRGKLGSRELLMRSAAEEEKRAGGEECLRVKPDPTTAICLLLHHCRSGPNPAPDFRSPKRLALMRH